MLFIRLISAANEQRDECILECVCLCDSVPLDNLSRKMVYSVGTLFAYSVAYSKCLQSCTSSTNLLHTTHFNRNSIKNPVVVVFFFKCVIRLQLIIMNYVSNWCASVTNHYHTFDMFSTRCVEIIKMLLRRAA